MPEVAVTNVLGYIVAMAVIAVAFGLFRLLIYTVSGARASAAPEGVQAQRQVEVPPQTLPAEVVAAAVAAVHEHLRSRARRPPSPAQMLHARPFISYWVLSERMNPAFQEVAHIRERGPVV